MSAAFPLLTNVVGPLSALQKSRDRKRSDSKRRKAEAALFADQDPKRRREALRARRDATSGTVLGGTDSQGTVLG
jgi:hypothetical protein